MEECSNHSQPRCCICCCRTLLTCVDQAPLCCTCSLIHALEVWQLIALSSMSFESQYTMMMLTNLCCLDFQVRACFTSSNTNPNMAIGTAKSDAHWHMQVSFGTAQPLCGLPDASSTVPDDFPADYFEFLQVRRLQLCCASVLPSRYSSSVCCLSCLMYV